MGEVLDQDFELPIASAGSPLSGSSMTAISFVTFAAPCRTVSLNYVRWPRKSLLDFKKMPRAKSAPTD
jgi:hypothetical protein